jgi:hypothetical protein
MADDVSEQDIFDSATQADEVSNPVDEQPTGEQPRDEQGRYAPQKEQAAASDPPQPQDKQPAAPEGSKPERESAPAWVLEERRNWQEKLAQSERDLAEMRGRQAAYEAFQRDQQRPQEQPKPEQPRPDLFENPEAYVQHQVQQLLAQQITPLQQQLQRDREEWSREAAIKEYGEETVKAAYSWLEEGARTRDPDRGMVFQKAMASSRPYLELVREYQHRQAIKQVGTDPNKWFETTLEQKLADPAFQADDCRQARPCQAERKFPRTFCPPRQHSFD